jgi:hypothetical protein
VLTLASVAGEIDVNPGRPNLEGRGLEDADVIAVLSGHLEMG